MYKLISYNPIILYQSMLGRIKAALEAKGGPTQY